MNLDKVRASAVSLSKRTAMLTAMARVDVATAEKEIQRLRNCGEMTPEVRQEIKKFRGDLVEHHAKLSLYVGRAYSAGTLVTVIDRGLLPVVLGEREPTEAEWVTFVYYGLAYPAIKRIPPDRDAPPGWYNVLWCRVVDMYHDIVAQIEAAQQNEG